MSSESESNGSPRTVPGHGKRRLVVGFAVLAVCLLVIGGYFVFGDTLKQMCFGTDGTCPVGDAVRPFDSAGLVIPPPPTAPGVEPPTSLTGESSVDNIAGVGASLDTDAHMTPE